MIPMKGLLTIIVFTMILAGCGNNITGSNTDLNAAHISTAAKIPDCTARGCHPAIGAAGTIFKDKDSETPFSGVTVKAQSISTGTLITLGTSDSLGNFHYHEELHGYYNMAVGSKPWSRPHSLPDWNGCNSCHTWPPAGGAKGKLN
jgi:hypothetical protein